MGCAYPECGTVVAHRGVGRAGWFFFGIEGPWDLCGDHEQWLLNCYRSHVWGCINRPALEDLWSDCPITPPDSWRPTWTALTTMMEEWRTQR